MAGTPRSEFARQVFPAGIAQFGDDPGIVGREPVLQFVQRLHAVQHRLRNDDVLLSHVLTIRFFGAKCQRCLSGPDSGKTSCG